MTEDEFAQLWIECSTDVADQFYPRGIWVYFTAGRRPRFRRGHYRGEYLRDQSVLYSKLIDVLKEKGVIVG